MTDLLASSSDDEDDANLEPAASRRRLDPPAQKAAQSPTKPAQPAAQPPQTAAQDGAPEGAAAATPATSSGRDSVLRVGMQVELQGFSSASMNGAKGKLGKYSEAKGIWQVFLEGTNTAKAVKPKNLKPVPKPAEGAPASTASAKRAREEPPPVAAPRETGKKVGEFNSMPKPTFTSFATDWRPDDHLPQDGDANGWLEVLRDVYVRQLREINQYPEPPPFHTIFEPVQDPTAPDTKALRQALTMQLQILTRARYGEGQQMNTWGKGAGGGKMMYPWQKGGKGNWTPTSNMFAGKGRPVFNFVGKNTFTLGKGAKPMTGPRPVVVPPIAPDLVLAAAAQAASVAQAGAAGGGAAAAPAAAPRVIEPTTATTTTTSGTD